MAGVFKKIMWLVIFVTYVIIYYEMKTFLYGKIRKHQDNMVISNYSPTILSYPGSLTNKSKAFLAWLFEGEADLKVILVRHPIDAGLNEFQRYQYSHDKMDRDFWPIFAQNYVKSWKRWHEQLLNFHQKSVTNCLVQFELLFNSTADISDGTSRFFSP